MKKTLKNEYNVKHEQMIQTAAIRDENSKLGTYLSINPTFTKPVHKDKLEFQRMCITKYFTGSHNLLIAKGKMYGHILREQRLCICNNDIQTIKHVLLFCPLLNNIREKYLSLGFIKSFHSYSRYTYLLTYAAMSSILPSLAAQLVHGHTAVISCTLPE